MSDLAVDVADADAADAAAAIADFLGEVRAFAFESYGRAGRDEGELGDYLRGARQLYLSDAACAGRVPLVLGFFVGWLLGGGGVGAGIGLWGDYWAAVDLIDLVRGYCRDRHVGWFVGRYV